MAIDSINKRVSAIGLALPFLMSLPFPDGSVDDDDRHQAAGQYSAYPVPSEGTIDTREKRAGGIAKGLMFLAVPPLADGEIALSDRRQTIGIYPGLFYLDLTPTTLDTEFLTDADELIEELGKTAKFWVYARDDYNPATGKVERGTPTIYTQKVIPPYEVDHQWVDGDVIQTGDMKSGVAAKDLEFKPARGMVMVVDAETWKVVKVKPVYAGELVVLYELFLRR